MLKGSLMRIYMSKYLVNFDNVLQLLRYFSGSGAFTSPRKRQYRTAGRYMTKKRRKKEECRESSKNSLLLSLMDRKFSFEQFPDNVPLYVLCRSWIRSFIGSDEPSSSNEPSAGVIRASKIPGAISKLPPPNPGNPKLGKINDFAQSKYPLDLDNLDAVIFRNDYFICNSKFFFLF